MGASLLALAKFIYYSEKTSHRPQLKNQDHYSARVHQQKSQRRP